VENVNPEYRRLAVVVISPERLYRGKRGDFVYIFEREAFNEVRKYVFLGDHSILEKKALLSLLLCFTLLYDRDRSNCCKRLLLYIHHIE